MVEKQKIPQEKLSADENAHFERIGPDLARKADEAIEETEKHNIDTWVFLDRSARILATLMRERWAKHHPHADPPRTLFINYGREKEEAVSQGMQTVVQKLRAVFSTSSQSINQARIMVIDDIQSTGKTMRGARALIGRVFLPQELVTFDFKQQILQWGAIPTRENEDSPIIEPALPYFSKKTKEITERLQKIKSQKPAYLKLLLSKDARGTLKELCKRDYDQYQLDDFDVLKGYYNHDLYVKDEKRDETRKNIVKLRNDIEELLVTNQKAEENFLDTQWRSYDWRAANAKLAWTKSKLAELEDYLLENYERILETELAFLERKIQSLRKKIEESHQVRKLMKRIGSADFPSRERK